MKLLSVVIPIYKVEPFLERCIRSLFAQDIPVDDYEIICVNDGSPDNSRGIVIQLQREYKNIILIDQENQGVSVARNRGFEKASGKYILFIDPDDYVNENTLSTILNEANSCNSQMAIPGYIFIDSDGIEQGRKIFNNYPKKVMNGMDAYYAARETGYIVTDTSVGVVFEAEFLRKNSLSYTRGLILNQDVEFLARAHCVAERCIFINLFFYVATSRQGSATRSNQFITEGVRDGFILGAMNLKRFQEIQALSSTQKSFLNGPIAKFVLLAVYSGARTLSIGKLYKTVKKLRSAGLAKLRLEGCSRYNAVCGKYYNVSPFLAAIVIVLYLKIQWRNN